MRKIAGPGHVSNDWADYDAVTNPTGTVVTAQFMQDTQDELMGIQDSAGISAAAGSNKYVLAAIIYNSIRYGKKVGEMWFSQFEETAAEFDPDNPELYNPVVEITGASQTISSTNCPDYVTKLRAARAKIGSTVGFTGSVTGSVLTLDDNADNAAILAALLEDNLFEASYTNWRTVNIAGTDYAITDVDGVTREITVTGTPATGAQTANFYPYRIAGSTTTARLLKADGLVLATAGASGRVAGLRMRDAMQQITGAASGFVAREATSVNGVFSGSTINETGVNTEGSTGDVFQPLSFDSANSTAQGGARAGENTKDRSLGAYLYVHVGRYIA